MKKLQLLVWVGLLCACGSDSSTPTPRVSASTPAEASEATTSEPAEPELPDEPLVANPAAQTAGDVTLTATACAIDGEPMHYSDFGVPGIVVSPDASALYLVDGDRALRRYTIDAGDDCALTLDTSFGQDGSLELGFGDEIGGRIEGMASDRDGRVFVSSSMRGSVRVTGSEITRCPASRGSMSIAPDGSWGIAVFAGSVRKVTWSEDGCDIEDYRYEEPFERASTFSFSGDELFITGAVGSNEFRAQRYNGAGEPQGERWGGTEITDPDKICSPGNVVTGSRGPVLLDQNCRSLIITTGDGTVAARINGMSLLGLRYPWIEAVTEPRDGIAFLAVSQERATGTRHFDAYVFRVSGL